MPHNTKLAFRSFKEGSEENKLIQMEVFKDNFLQSYINLFFYFIDLVIKSLFFTFRSSNYHPSNPQLCNYFTWKTFRHAWNTETLLFKMFLIKTLEILKFYYYIENLKNFRKPTYEKLKFIKTISLLCIDLLPEKLLQAIKSKKNDMNRSFLPQIFPYTKF